MGRLGMALVVAFYPGGDVRCFAGGRRVETGPGAVTAGVWQHVACTHEGDTTRIYVDGTELLAQDDGGDIGPGTSGVSVAGNGPSGDPFIGALDNLRVWTAKRGEVQICEAARCQP